MYESEQAVNRYEGDGPMTTEKPASVRDELRFIRQSVSEQRKMDAELMERLQQLVNRVDHIERTIGE